MEYHVAMNAPKVTDLDYINFLIAAPKVVSCTEAARVQPDGPRRAAHDALTRLLQRLDPDSTPLWREAEQHVDRQSGLLILDDTTLDKPYARKIALVHRHWSGKHHRVVKGINLLTVLWSDGTDAIPCDYRLFAKPVDGLSKILTSAPCWTGPKRVGLCHAMSPSIVGTAAWPISRPSAAMAGTG